MLQIGFAQDIRRPCFTNLRTGFTFDPSENAAVSLGNPGLEPEEVESIDLAFEWYFAPSAVASIGYFKKDRTNIFGQDYEGALLVPEFGSWLFHSGSDEAGLSRTLIIPSTISST